MVTYTVDLLLDENDGTVTPGDLSLREAISLSNASSGITDTIAFASGLTGTITLGGTALSITDSVFIDGPGANTLASAATMPRGCSTSTMAPERCVM